MAANALGRPRTKPAGERRDDLMMSAERLFLEKGVEQTTIEDIALGASISKGAFYLHFSSKADVIQALRSRFVQDVADRIKEHIHNQADDDWNGKLTSWATACAIGYLEATRLHQLIFTAAPAPSRKGLTDNILIDHLAELLGDGNRAGAWSLTDPRFTAVFLFSALHGVVEDHDVAEAGSTRSELLREAETHFHRTVRPDAAVAA